MRLTRMTRVDSHYYSNKARDGIDPPTSLTFLYHIHYINSDLRRYFLIDGYSIFLSVRLAKFYLWNTL